MHIMLFSCQHYDQDSFSAANAAGAFTLSFQPSRLTPATAALAEGVLSTKVKELMADESIRLIVLDELNIALRYDYLPLDDVLAGLAARREGQHVIVTGRNAKPALIEAADLVTEMGLVKHHFAAGVKAQKGIEF